MQQPLGGGWGSRGRRNKPPGLGIRIEFFLSFSCFYLYFVRCLILIELFFFFFFALFRCLFVVEMFDVRFSYYSYLRLLVVVVCVESTTTATVCSNVENHGGGLDAMVDTRRIQAVM